jgi:hypothetical protein
MMMGVVMMMMLMLMLMLMMMMMICPLFQGHKEVVGTCWNPSIVGCLQQQ